VAAAAETGFKGQAPWSGAAGPSLPPTGTQSGHTLTRLLTLALLPTDIAIGGEGATLARMTVSRSPQAAHLRVMHTFDDAGADVAQGCCEWRNNRLVGRTKAGLKGSLASSNVCGRRSHYR